MMIGFTELGYWTVHWADPDGEPEPRTIPSVIDYIEQRLEPYGEFGVGYAFYDSDIGSGLPRLTRLESGRTTLASYEGLMSGMAHRHGNRPVTGKTEIEVELDYRNDLNLVDVSFTDIEGAGFSVPDITFPTMDGECCEDRKPDGFAHNNYFQIDQPNFYLKGRLTGEELGAAHGIFSTADVTGGFGAMQNKRRPGPTRAVDTIGQR